MPNPVFPSRLSETGDHRIFGFSVQCKPLTESFPLHWHDFYEFEWITGGSGIHIVNGAEQPLTPGDLIVVSPVDLHSITLQGNNLKHTTVHFNERFLSKIAKQIMISLPKQVLHFTQTDQNALDAIFAYLAEIEDLPLIQKEQIIKNRIEAVLLYCVQSGTAYARDAHGILAAVDYIDRQFRTGITLAEAAKQAGFSANAFSTQFHKIIGITFQEYIVKKRLEWSYAMLKATDLSVSQIAFDSGFNSHAHFTRSFQKYYGITPGEVRK